MRTRNANVLTRLEREAARRAARTALSFGEDARHAREDAGLTQRSVAGAAGISQSHYAAIESGVVVASIETIQAVALALGGDVSVRFFPGTGPRLRDRIQAPMVEAFLHILHPRWQRFPEVPVHRPASGVIDLVIGSAAESLLVATEFHSQVRRLEQQVRWARIKADGLATTPLTELISNGDHPIRIDRLLVLRSTTATRGLARDFAATLAAAYPARTAEVLASLAGDAPWPGAGVVWVTIDKHGAHVMERMPPGVRLGH
jgi:transcriptional regulator with XRE-family HTH domain